MRRQPALDGLRGVAIALVVCEHAHLLGGGNLGVVVFFVLSGYLITGLLLGGGPLPTFYGRRAVRLLPALMVALAGLAVASRALGAPGAEVAGWVALSLLYVVNLAITAAGWQLLRPVDFVWTLSLEEQFYLLWPVTLRRALRRRPRAAVARWLLGIAAMVALARFGWVAAGGDPTTAYFAPWFRADGLLAGSALALLPPWRVGRFVPLAVVTVAVAAWVGSPYLHPLVALGLAVPAVTLASGVLVSAQPAFLSWAPLRYLGRISYALYLWNGVVCAVWLQHTGHYPAGWLGVPVGVAVSVALAVASTHLLEEPLRRAWRQPSRLHEAQLLAHANPPACACASTRAADSADV